MRKKNDCGEAFNSLVVNLTHEWKLIGETKKNSIFYYNQQTQRARKQNCTHFDTRGKKGSFEVFASNKQAMAKHHLYLNQQSTTLKIRSLQMIGNSGTQWICVFDEYKKKKIENCLEKKVKVFAGDLQIWKVRRVYGELEFGAWGLERLLFNGSAHTPELRISFKSHFISSKLSILVK